MTAREWLAIFKNHDQLTKVFFSKYNGDKIVLIHSSLLQEYVKHFYQVK